MENIRKRNCLKAFVVMITLLFAVLGASFCLNGGSNIAYASESTPSICDIKISGHQIYNLKSDFGTMKISGYPYDASEGSAHYSQGRFDSSYIEGRYFKLVQTNDNLYPLALYLYDDDGTPVVAEENDETLPKSSVYSNIGRADNQRLDEVDFITGDAIEGFITCLEIQKMDSNYIHLRSTNYNENTQGGVTHEMYGYNFAISFNEILEQDSEIPWGVDAVDKSTTAQDEFDLSYMQASQLTTSNLSFEINSGSRDFDTYFPYAYIEGQETDLLQYPVVKAGYNFLGWTLTNDANDETYYTKIPDTFTGDKTYMAEFVLDDFNVTFDTDGGSAVTAGTYDIEDESFVLPAITPTKDGYTFAGWKVTNIESGVNGFVLNEIYQASETITLADSYGDVELTAQWTPITYTITYHLNGGVQNPLNVFNYTIESDEITLYSVSKDGYNFNHWEDDNIGLGNVYDNIPKGSSENLVLYAHWSEANYQINYVLNDGTNNDSNPATYKISDNTITLLDPQKDYAEFIGWFSADGTNGNWGSEVITIDQGSFGTKTIYAKWNNFAAVDYDFYINTTTYEKIVFKANQGAKIDASDEDAGLWEDTVYANKNAENKTVTIYTLQPTLFGQIDMSGMFEDCDWIKEIDFGQIDTSQTKYMDDMFRDCTSLISLNLVSFDTSNVIDIEHMFEDCYDLLSLDVSSFDTSNVVDLSDMFEGCQKLTTLDLSSFYTPKVTNFGDMFEDCYELTTLDIPNFDTSNAIYMYNMFKNCQNLTTLNVSNFDTSNATSMYNMFEDCQKLTTLNVSNFDTSNAKLIQNMFRNCKSLTSLDLSSFTMPGIQYDEFDDIIIEDNGYPAIIDSENMLYGCDSLSYIKAPNILRTTIALPNDDSWLQEDAYSGWSSVCELNNNSEGKEIYRKQKGTIYDVNFYQPQVWDCQRYPAFPIEGKTIRISGLGSAYDEDFNTIIWEDGDYVRFEKANSTVLQIENEEIRNRIISSLSSYTNCTEEEIGNAVVVRQVLFNKNGEVKDILSEYGLVWAFGNQGFLHTAMDGAFASSGGIGTFVSYNNHKPGDVIAYRTEKKTPYNEDEVEERDNIVEQDPTDIPTENYILISGTVIDENGTPLHYAEVEIEYNGITYPIAFTSDDGSFISRTIQRAASNDYKVHIKWQSFATITYNRTLSDFGFGNDINTATTENSVYVYNNPATNIVGVDQTYTITFSVGDSANATLNKTSVDVAAGSQILINGNKLYVGGVEVIVTPTNDAEYSRELESWNIDSGTIVNSNLTITPTFTKTLNSYTVTFDIDGNLTTQQVAYGATPSFTGATPTKPATAEHTFTFTGWNSSFNAVVSDITYTAQFTSTVNQYEIVWKNHDNTILETDTVAYGTLPTFNGTTPTKTSTITHSFTFSGWNSTVVAVSGNKTYIAQFDSQEILSQVNISSKHGEEIANTLADFKIINGSAITILDNKIQIASYNFEAPSQIIVNGKTLIFDKWNVANGTTITPDTTIFAKYVVAEEDSNILWLFILLGSILLIGLIILLVLIFRSRKKTALKITKI